MIEKEKFQKMWESIVETKDSHSLNDKVLIIDSMNTFIRCFAANSYTNDNGMHVGGYVGFMYSVGTAIDILKPTRVIFAFDGLHARARRVELYSEYKSQRNHNLRLVNNKYLTKEEEKSGMTIQMRRLSQYLMNLPCNISIHDYLEADDLIYLYKKFLPESSNIVIMSTDMDFYQLIDERTVVYQPTKKEIVDEKVLKELFNIHPSNVGLYKSIIGDVSDNIKGVDGVAIKKLQKYLPILFTDKQISFEQLLDKCKETDNFTTRSILENKEVIERNLKLIVFEYQQYNRNIEMLIEQEIEQAPYKLNMSVILKFILEDKINGLFKSPIEYFKRIWSQLNTISTRYESN